VPGFLGHPRWWPLPMGTAPMLMPHRQGEPRQQLRQQPRPAVWQNRPIYTRSSTDVPAKHVDTRYFHLYKPGSPPSITNDLDKSTLQPRSHD
jgi:hypothetical protein